MDGSLAQLVESMGQSLKLTIRQREFHRGRAELLMERLMAERRGQPVSDELAELRAAVLELREQLAEADALVLRNATGWQACRAKLETYEAITSAAQQRYAAAVERLTADTIVA